MMLRVQQWCGLGHQSQSTTQGQPYHVSHLNVDGKADKYHNVLHNHHRHGQRGERPPAIRLLQYRHLHNQDHSLHTTNTMLTGLGMVHMTHLG